jgi:hypothetical protein
VVKKEIFGHNLGNLFANNDNEEIFGEAAAEERHVDDFDYEASENPKAVGGNSDGSALTPMRPPTPTLAANPTPPPPPTLTAQSPPLPRPSTSSPPQLNPQHDQVIMDHQEQDDDVEQNNLNNLTKGNQFI